MSDIALQVAEVPTENGTYSFTHYMNVEIIDPVVSTYDVKRYSQKIKLVTGKYKIWNASTETFTDVTVTNAYDADVDVFTNACREDELAYKLPTGTYKWADVMPLMHPVSLVYDFQNTKGHTLTANNTYGDLEEITDMAFSTPISGGGFVFTATCASGEIIYDGTWKFYNQADKTYYTTSDNAIKEFYVYDTFEVSEGISEAVENWVSGWGYWFLRLGYLKRIGDVPSGGSN